MPGLFCHLPFAPCSVSMHSQQGARRKWQIVQPSEIGGTFCAGAFLPPAFCPMLRFNALRALGYFSTRIQSCALTRANVSMHFVLWDTSQRVEKIFSASLPTFQCTSCFGILLNVTVARGFTPSACFNALRALGYFSTRRVETIWPSVFVSMHFVLWDTSQR